MVIKLSVFYLTVTGIIIQILLNRSILACLIWTYRQKDGRAVDLKKEITLIMLSSILKDKTKIG